MRALEESEGRERFDHFLRAWITRHAFQSVTSDAFVSLVHELLPGAETRVPLEAWLDAPGLPAGAPSPRSARWTALQAAAHRLAEGALPTADEAARFTPAELLLFLQSLPATLDAATCARVDALFGLQEKRSFELRCAFLVAALRAGLPGADQRCAAILRTIGRMKFLKPLYGALVARAETKAFARTLFEECAQRYQPDRAQRARAALRLSRAHFAIEPIIAAG